MTISHVAAPIVNLLVVQAGVHGLELSVRELFECLQLFLIVAVLAQLGGRAGLGATSQGEESVVKQHAGHLGRVLRYERT